MPEGHGTLRKRNETIKCRARQCCNGDARPDHVDIEPTDGRRDAETHAHHRRAQEEGDLAIDGDSRQIVPRRSRQEASVGPNPMEKASACTPKTRPAE